MARNIGKIMILLLLSATLHSAKKSFQVSMNLLTPIHVTYSEELKNVTIKSPKHSNVHSVEFKENDSNIYRVVCN